MRGCCTLEIHPLKSVDTLTRKNVFFLEIAATIPVMLLICGLAVDFNFFTANVCGKKSVSKFATLNLESAICGFVNLRTGLMKCPALLFSMGNETLKPKRSGISDEHFEMLAFLKGN